MILSYRNIAGEHKYLELTERDIVIGRSTEADIQIEDPRASRRHAQIRYWEGDYVIKDLHSNNGTYVNGRRIDVAVLSVNSRIVVAGHDIRVQSKRMHNKGTSTILREVGEEFKHGKGYGTIMREVVSDLRPRQEVSPSPAEEPAQDKEKEKENEKGE